MHIEINNLNSENNQGRVTKSFDDLAKGMEIFEKSSVEIYVQG